MWIFNSRGVAIVGIIATLLFLSVLGLTAANLITISQTLMSVEVQKERARMIAMAGLEYGLKNPTPTTKTFADGQFTITIGDNGFTVTSVGTYGDAQETYSANITTQAAGCLKFSGGTFGSKTVSGIQLVRYAGCPSSTTTIIDKIKVTWKTSLSSEKVTKITIGGTTWTGSASSGDVIDIPDTTVTTTAKSMTITWNKTLNSDAKQFDFVFTMTDGTSATYTRTFGTVP